MYTIQLENGETLINGLDDSGLDNWWAANQNQYFGLRVENGNTIIVCRTSIPLTN
jgi:hypothetical protein